MDTKKTYPVLTNELLIEYVRDICNDSRYGYEKQKIIVNKETFDALMNETI